MSAALALTVATSCKKKGCTDPSAVNYSKSAKKDDGSCTYKSEDAYTVPSTYTFVNASGASTVSYTGQANRLKQLRELITYAKLGRTQVISAQVLKDMWENTNGNGNGQFTFTSSAQLKNKCYPADVAAIETLFDEIAAASESFAVTAASGMAGVATSTTTTSSKYLLDANGRDMAEWIEKSIMRSVFFYQALTVYLGADKMNGDNTTVVAGNTYTALEHSWDEAFGYFGVPVDFPTNTTAADLYYWGKYCNGQNAALNAGCSAFMMNNFLKGRAAITAKVLADRDAALVNIRTMWEKIAAVQIMKYMDDAVANFADDAKRLHAIGECYGFVTTLKYAPLETRKMTNQEVDAVIALFGSNMWDLSVSDLNAIRAAIDSKY